MEVRATENYQDRYFAVVIEGNKVIKVEFLDGLKGDTWLSKYFTVDAIYKSGKDFCYPFECLIRIDNTYDYPKVLAFEGQGIIVQNFQPCELLNDCVNIR